MFISQITDLLLENFWLLYWFALLVVVIHIIKSGRSYWWIHLVAFMPVIGIIAYFVVEIYPNIRWGILAKLNSLVTSKKQIIKGLRREVQLVDSCYNRTRLAEALYSAGHYGEAAEEYKKAARGQFSHDPCLNLSLAKAHFAANQLASAEEVLKKLEQTGSKEFLADRILLRSKILEADNSQDNRCLIKQKGLLLNRGAKY